MGTQKIINLLNSSENEYSKFATKKWYVINSKSKGNYSHENPINFLTNSLEFAIIEMHIFSFSFSFSLSLSFSFSL